MVSVQLARPTDTKFGKGNGVNLASPRGRRRTVHGVRTGEIRFGRRPEGALEDSQGSDLLFLLDMPDTHSCTLQNVCGVPDLEQVGAMSAKRCVHALRVQLRGRPSKDTEAIMYRLAHLLRTEGDDMEDPDSGDIGMMVHEI
eukprot:1514285-Rhodomonas_salina.1